ncbi:Thioredoxin- transmembrane protein 1 [Podila minutissima]|nr:Thioredoxin- transmembrane protein 1 [Podila minutissima]
MKFFKSSLATIAAIALIAPAAAQYGKDDIAEKEANGGIFQTVKLLLTGGAATSLFEADPNGVIFNITDANYRDTLFKDEWIVTFCSPASAPCADYFPTYLDVATTMQNETNTRFAAVWVDDNSRLATRFFVPSRLPFVVYAKDGEFRQIPYNRNETQFLIDFIEEEQYKNYPIMSGPMSPTSTLAHYFEKYADFSDWVGTYTSWMPRWMIYIVAGSMSGMVFNLFSGGSSYSSDPAKYAHLNADGTLKKKSIEDTSASVKTEKKEKKSSKTSSSSTKKKSSKKEKAN